MGDKNMAETISEENLLTMHNRDYTTYAVYVARRRALPSPVDGLKPIHRKIIWAMLHDHSLYYDRPHKKTMKVVGTVIGSYHPHGDASVSDAIQPMANWFEIYMPLIDGHGNFGSMYGDKASAPRYTEIRLSKYAQDCIVGPLRETKTAVDWMRTYDDSAWEPVYFPAAVPNLLINGSFGIAVGMKTHIPKHNINEVIDAAINLIHHPNASVVLVPDNCSGSDIIDSDFEKISKTGKGTYQVRGRMEIIDYKGYPALEVLSMPDMVFFETVKEQLSKLSAANVLPQIKDILNLTEEDKVTKRENFKVYIVLKKGSDPNYVKEVIYAATSMQATVAVNFEVINNETPELMNYKTYLLNFIELNKQAKFRLYSNKIQVEKTKYHEMELYIRAMESGEIDEIIALIRKQKGTDDAVYVDMLVKKLDITPLQAKFLLATNIKKLSMGYLANYKELRVKYYENAERYTQIVTSPQLILEEIEADLKRFKKEFGFPRKSAIISKESDIPDGEFQIVITQGNFIRKIGVDDRVGCIAGDPAKFIIPVNNKENLIVFDERGRVYSYPVHKIPFAKGGSNGVTWVALTKRPISGICSAMSDSILKDIDASPVKTFIYIITEEGYIKRMDIADFLTVNSAGTVYSKLGPGDRVKDIIYMPEECDLIIYARNKVLRMNGTEAPYLKRSTRGNNAMDTKELIDGFACLYPSATHVVVVTESGRVNKVSINGVPLSTRARAGSSIIKLGKTDTIKKIMVCKPESKIAITDKDGVKVIAIADIPEGSSISAGTKLANSGVIDVNLV